MNAKNAPTFSVPISFLAAALLGHRGLPSKQTVKWENENTKASLSLLAALYRAQWSVELAGLGPFVVTSALDHEGIDDREATSLHPKGRAADLRTRHLKAEQIDRFWNLVADAVGPGYDVILEVDHVHLEHDPRVENAVTAYMGER